MMCRDLAKAWQRQLIVSIAALLFCATAGSQITNSARLSLMPSVDQVKSAIQGSDPTDTQARQVAVFTYLSQIIQRMKMHRSYSGSYTADEQRVMGAYDLAAYQITQAYAKSHTVDETKAFNQLHGRYEMNSQFYNDWYQRLLPAQFRAQYEGNMSSDAAQAKAHFDDERRQATQAVTRPAAGGGLNDPGTQSVRRCLELGGSDMTCLAKGVGTGLLDMVGMKPGDLAAPSSAGLVLNGNWKSRTISLNFGPAQVMLSGCGQLVADNYPYTIARKGSVLQISMRSQPAPIVLTMPSAQSLSGPGSVSVTGKIVVGTRHVWMAHYHNGVRDGTGYWQDEPIYGPKTDRCTIGEFAAAQPAPAAGSGDGLLGVLGGMMSELTPETSAPAALRIAGEYTGQNGLKLDFDAATVTLDCAQAHVKQNYTVQNTPAGILINVQNGASPFTLTYAPDGSLSGSGTIQVDGRLLVAMTGGSPQFAPTTARCAIGSLTNRRTASN